MANNNDIQSAIAAGTALAGPITHPSTVIPIVVVPDGYKAESLERLLPAPARKSGTITVSNTGSLIDYLKKHGDANGTVVYADIDSEASKCKLIAIINDHDSVGAQWRDHRATFAPKLAVEWSRWTLRNKACMTQADFASWLEDNLTDVRSVAGSPDGSQILAMALAFEANADKRLRSRINLQSGGVQFEFSEEEKPDTRTTMQAFERFTLAMPVFDGETVAYPIEARLKYRADKEGKVSFWYELIRPDRVFKTAVAAALEQVATETGFLIIQGTP